MNSGWQKLWVSRYSAVKCGEGCWGHAAEPSCGVLKVMLKLLILHLYFWFHIHPWVSSLQNIFVDGSGMLGGREVLSVAPAVGSHKEPLQCYHNNYEWARNILFQKIFHGFFSNFFHKKHCPRSGRANSPSTGNGRVHTVIIEIHKWN